MPITRENYVAGLRAIADFYEQHPEIHLPVSIDAEREDFTNYFCSSPEKFAVAGAAIAPFNTVLPKDEGDHASVFIEREMVPGITLRFHTLRKNACRKVTKTIPAHTIEVPEKTMDVWECSEILTPAPADLTTEQYRDLNRTGLPDLGAIRDLIVEGSADLQVDAEPPRVILTEAGAAKLSKNTGIPFKAGDPVPMIEAPVSAGEAAQA